MPAPNPLRDHLTARLSGRQKAAPSGPDGGPRADTRIQDYYRQGKAGGPTAPPPAPIDEYGDEEPEEPTAEAIVGPASLDCAALKRLTSQQRAGLRTGDPGSIDAFARAVEAIEAE